MKPIYINLSGDYIIPRAVDAPRQQGSVSGDLRLESLDALLHTLRNAVRGEQGSKFEAALDAIIQRCSTTLLDKGDDIVLTITSTIDHDSSKMVHDFKISAVPANTDQDHKKSKKL